MTVSVPAPSQTPSHSLLGDLPNEIVAPEVDVRGGHVHRVPMASPTTSGVSVHFEAVAISVSEHFPRPRIGHSGATRAHGDVGRVRERAPGRALRSWSFGAVGEVKARGALSLSLDTAMRISASSERVGPFGLRRGLVESR